MADDATAVLAPAPTSMEKKADNASAADVTAEILRRMTAATEEPADQGDTNTQTASTEETEPAPEVEAETTGVEAEAAIEEQPAVEEEAPDEVLSKLTPEQQAILNQRIGKEVKKRKVLEEAKAAIEAEKTALAQAKAELEAKLQTIAATPPQPAAIAPTPDDPLANVETPDALEKERQQARQIRRHATRLLEDNPDSDEITVGKVTFTRAELREKRDLAEAMLEEHIPARDNYLRQRGESWRQFEVTFPWASDQKSEEFQSFAAVIKHTPHLQRDPRAPLLAAVYAEGLKAIKARAEAGKKPAPAARVAANPPPVVETTVAPPRRPTAVAATQAKRTTQLRNQVTSQNASSADIANVLLQMELEKQGA